ncbi:MAG: tetratricopeptide repeat protein [Bryobacteraceae bacterium]|nr:tetratricopeptide repeat protein [Bryobacterales bacterium]NUN00288.1 tetratricopeptide repeat protein [Bryobacteraceae bacterium]
MANSRLIRVTALLVGLAAIAAAQMGELARALREQRFADAHALAQAMLNNASADPRLWTLDGMALAGMNRPRESIAAYNHALKADATYLPAWLGKAEVEYRSNDSGAAGTLVQVLKLDPGNATAHAMLASLAFARRDCAAALPHFARGRDEALKTTTATWQWAQCELMAGEAGEAAALFERLLQAGPPRSEIFSLLASAQERSGAPDKAVQTLRRAAELFPQEESHYLDLGALCAEHHEYDLGIEVLEVGVRNVSSSPAIRVLRGVLFVLKGDFSAASTEFDRADAVGAAIGTAYATMFSPGADSGQAAAKLRAELRTHPDDAVLHYLLAECSSSDEERRQLLERAVQLKPGFAKAHSALGRLYAQRERPGEAIRELRLAVKLDPTDQPATYRLALKLRDAGRKEEAAELFNRLRTLRIAQRKADEAKRKLAFVKQAPSK